MYKLMVDWDRVEKAKERIKTAYGFKTPDQLPFIFEPDGFDWGKLTIKQRLTDDEQALRELVDYINFRFKLFPDSDYVPVLNVSTGGEFLIPSMFSAKYSVKENQMPTYSEPFIKDINKDLNKLSKRVDPFKDGLMPLALKRTSFFLKKTKKRIPVTFVDTESPLSLALNLMDQSNFFIQLNDYPDKMKELMHILARTIVKVVKAQMEVAGEKNLINPRMNLWLPFREGITLYDDYNHLLSPEMYLETCKDIYEEVISVLGGNGHLHTCGPCFTSLSSMMSIKGCKSIDFTFLKDSGKITSDFLDIKKISQAKKVLFFSRVMPVFREDISNQLREEISRSAYPLQQTGSDNPPQGFLALSDENKVDIDWIKRMNQGGGFIYETCGPLKKGKRLRELINKAGKNL